MKSNVASDPLAAVLGLLLSACATAPAPHPLVAVATEGPAAAPSASATGGFVELMRRPGHRDEQVCKYRRVACRITERVPGFGSPNPLGHVQTTSEKPGAAAAVIAQARRAALDCLQAAPFANRPVRYRVWIAPDGRVSKVTAAARMVNTPVRRCGRRLSHRVYPAFSCGYGFEVHFAPMPR